MAVYQPLTNGWRNVCFRLGIGLGVVGDPGCSHDEAFIAVLDRGPGLDEGEADHVFDRFYRGRSSQGGSVPGTGLGLAIVETLARRWGGRAALVNRPGGGARAQVRFPVVETAAARSQKLVTPTVAR